MINLALIKTSFTKEAIDNEELDERTTEYENPLLDIPDEPMDEALPDSDSKEVREKVLAFPDLQHAVYIFTNMADEIFDQLKKRKNLKKLFMMNQYLVKSLMKYITQYTLQIWKTILKLQEKQIHS